MAVMTEHVGIDRVNFRDDYIKSFFCLIYNGFYTADYYFSLVNNIGNFMNGVIKTCSKRMCKIVNELSLIHI